MFCRVQMLRLGDGGQFHGVGRECGVRTKEVITGVDVRQRVLSMCS
jgi:hypothetical protein